ncbi:MAG: ATP-binding protein [Caldilineaceae bacterium]|nr:ATP-binding protein [Caldilineaceae bacterium]
MAGDLLRFNQEQLEEDIQQALSDWHQMSRLESPFTALYLYRRFLQESLGNIQQATNRLLDLALEQLNREYPVHVDVLRGRYVEGQKADVVAGQLNMSQATFHRKRNEALPLLTAEIVRMEEAERSAYRQRMERRLEISASPHLFGRSERIAQLLTLIETTEAPWLFALVGIGGIGKTTLADALARRLIESPTFYGIGWTTARQTTFSVGGSLSARQQPTLSSAILVERLCKQLLGEEIFHVQRSAEELLLLLEEHLRAYPHFIVIDNLESVHDVGTLLPLLRRLANPSKFLITTRNSLYDEPDLYHITVPELEWKDSLALIRQEIEARNITSGASAKETELFPIYETVGGNPLALRLVVGQLHRHPLAAVLNDLVSARGSQAEALYTHIYWHAWSQLTPTEQDVFIAMPLVSEQGGRLDLLAAMCELEESELRQAVDTLAVLNLIDVRGDLYERRYTIHSLTRSFLHEQVIRWQQEALEAPA